MCLGEVRTDVRDIDLGYEKPRKRPCIDEPITPSMLTAAQADLQSHATKDNEHEG